jgi:hypothetical protein
MFNKAFFIFGISLFTCIILGFEFKTNDSENLQLETKNYKSKYVVIFVIDGPRYSETFGDTACTLIPRMGKELVKEGTLFTNFQNNGVTHTNPGHAAITTGVYQNLKNNGKELPKNPSIFQYFLKAKNADKTDAWVISSKGKLHVLANTKDNKWQNSYIPSVYCGLNGNAVDYVGDSFTWKKIVEVFTKSAPRLTLINLLEVDVNGHQNNWEGYKQGIRNCDEYAYKFWNMIQENPAMKDKTTLLITNDHGRHLDGRKDSFKSHGDKCEGCKHISLLAIGPDIKKDFKISTEAEMIDISKTIGEILQFEVPTSKGRVLHEMFVDEAIVE